MLIENSLAIRTVKWRHRLSLIGNPYINMHDFFFFFQNKLNKYPFGVILILIRDWTVLRPIPVIYIFYCTNSRNRHSDHLFSKKPIPESFIPSFPSLFLLLGSLIGITFPVDKEIIVWPQPNLSDSTEFIQKSHWQEVLTFGSPVLPQGGDYRLGF